MSYFANYRKVMEQAFIPLFVKDDFDTEVLLEGCRLAEIPVLEYTQRREDSHLVIPTLKERFPDAVVLVGSTIDADCVMNQLKSKYPQCMTIDQLAPYVDGFVSILPYSDETLHKYGKSHICIPAAETGGEALRQVRAGAAFIKVIGPDMSFSQKLHSAPTFGYCPTYITGGITRERMDEAFRAGNVLCAAGFDVILRGEDPKTLTAERVAELITSFVDTAKKARVLVNPGMADLEKMSDRDFIKALPNYCCAEI